MATLAIFVAVLLIQNIGCMHNGTGYLLTMPRILQAGAKERFCMSLHGSMDFTPYLLTLTHQDTEIKEEFTLWTDEGGCKELAIPDKVGKYDVALLQSDSNEVLSEMEVEVKGQNLITFIQTDKPIYKPGQKVQYRIMTMKRDLKPRVGKISAVFVKDPNDIRVKQWLEVDTDGLSSFEFQLADEPKLGIWTIEANVDDEVTKQTFTVKEYVLPKFEVTIIPPKYILANTSMVTGEICAKYTYGQPVKGFLKADICLGGYTRMSGPCASVKEKIDGCYSFSVKAMDVGFTQGYYLYRSKLIISATVTERDTGNEVKKSHTGPSISFDPLEIKLEDDTNKYFKPSFPYRGRATITKPDGTPAPGEDIEITMINYVHDIRMSKTFKSDENGLIYFYTCDPISSNISDFRIEAKGVAYAESYDSPPSFRMYMPRGFSTIKQWFSPSLSYIQIPQIQDTVKCGEEVTLDVPYTTTLDSYTLFHFQVMSRGRILHHGHKEHHFLKHDTKSALEVPEEQCLIRERVTPPPPPPTSTTTVKPEVHALNPESMMKVPVETAEEQPRPWKMQQEGERQEVEEEEIKPETFEPLNAAIRKKRSYMPFMGDHVEIPVEMSDDPSTHVSHVKVKFVVTPEMSPKASLLVYYIRDDGETVADSIQFNVESCFRNKVSMEFTEKQVLPGATTSIKLEAAPGSVCSVGVVDKSINILGGDHQVTPDKLFQKLEEFSLSRYEYNYYSDDDYCEKKDKDNEDEEEDTETETERAPPEIFMHPQWSVYSSKYVDAVQAFKSMGLLVMTNLVLETRPCTRKVQRDRDFAFYAAIPERSLVPSPSARSNNAQVVEIRNFFPETWMWELEHVGDDGELIIMRDAPHTITEWIGNTVCTSSEVGFGFAPMTSLTTFQPFFLSFSLPYAALRGERLPIRITVFNYLDKCLMMQMKLEDSDVKIEYGNSDNKAFCLCGGDSHTKKYYVVPEELGQLSITASAEIVPGHCGNSVEMDTQYTGRRDTVMRYLFVKSEGVIQEYSLSKYMCPMDGKQVEVFDLPIPDDIILESARGEISVIGDIMGPALSNLDNLISQPTGCGEQTMVKFTPNIFVLKYLNSVDQNTEEIEILAKQYMEIGYQRELKFRHADGSFSAFGESDKSGSTWLTAFVVQSFAQARDYIYIDSKDLEKSIEFLMGTQLENGCFREVGKVFSSYMMGGLGKTDEEDDVTALTAYIIISLLEANVARNDSVLKMAINCLNLQENIDDIYTKAIIAYANVMYDVDSDHSKKAMEALNAEVIKDGSLLHWGRKSEIPKPVSSWYHFTAPSAEVEMTAYGMLASLVYNKVNPVGSVLPIAMWMSEQRTAFGGYASTQDTVVGLHALSEFAGILYHDNEDANVTEELSVSMVADDLQSSVMVNEDNSLLLQKVKLTQLPNVVTATASGRGCALVQANVRYNKAPENLGIDRPLFNLSVKTSRPNDDCSLKRILICVSYKSQYGYSDGMSLVTVSMVTGWSHVPQSLKKLRSHFSLLNMKKYEINKEDGSLNFYFDELDKHNRCFEFDVQQNKDLAVSAPKPATVKIMQYYEKEVTAIKSYELKTICGTKAEIPRRMSEEDLINPFIQRRIEAMPVIESVQPKISCPKCSNSPPENLQDLVCQSGAVLKVLAGRDGKVSMKVKSDLRPKRKHKIDEFVSVEIEKECECHLIAPPVKGKRVKRLLIFKENSDLKPTDQKEKKLVLNKRSHVVNLDLNKSLERKVRLMSKICRKRQRQP